MLKRILNLFIFLVLAAPVCHAQMLSNIRPLRPRAGEPIKLTTPPKGFVTKVSSATGMHNGHGYVDLGLPSGTLWSTTYVGAGKPTEKGLYFSWGETVPLKFEGEIDDIREKTKYYISKDKFSKYVVHEHFGKVDGRKELVPSDDPAHVHWGKGWRTPSAGQLLELYEKCSWVKATVDGQIGVLVIGPNGNTIFFCDTTIQWKQYHIGTGFTSRTLHPTEDGYVARMRFAANPESTALGIPYGPRYSPSVVRPVLEKK